MGPSRCRLARLDGRVVRVFERRCDCGAQFTEFVELHETTGGPCLVCGSVADYPRRSLSQETPQLSLFSTQNERVP